MGFILHLWHLYFVILAAGNLRGWCESLLSHLPCLNTLDPSARFCQGKIAILSVNRG